MLPADVTVARAGNDLILQIVGTGDQLTVKDQFYSTDSFFNGDRIERFQFADGTLWTGADVDVRILAQQRTAGADAITGFDSVDTLDGAAGNDTLTGLKGEDTFIFGRGYGQDAIDDNGNASSINADIIFDRVSFKADVAQADLVLSRSGNDLVIGISGTTDQLTIKDQFYSTFSFYNPDRIERFGFSDGSVWTAAEMDVRLLAASATAGNDTIVAYDSVDTLDGLAGNDVLSGRTDADTYLFGRGSGADLIDEDGTFSSSFAETAPDVVSFKAGVAPTDLELSRVGNDLVIRIIGTADQLTVKDQFYAVTSFYNPDRIERFTFADGTVWTAPELDARVLRAMSSAGNDTLVAYESADTLDGLAGNDSLSGKTGQDTYVFARGYGEDLIDENGDWGNAGASTTLDTVAFKTGVAPTDVALAKVGMDLTVAIAGTTDRLTVKDQFLDTDSYWNGDLIERLAFADGTSWNPAQILNRAHGGDGTNAVTAGDDVIVGTHGADTLDGLAGNDLLAGMRGNDTYRFTQGGGNDTVREEGFSFDIDTLQLVGLNPADVQLIRVGADLKVRINATGETATVLSHFTSFDLGVEQLTFANGTTWNRSQIAANAWIEGTSGPDTLVGTDGNDRIEGKGGDDTLLGGFGDDTYWYTSGDGSDVIRDVGWSFNIDTLKLTNLNVADLTFARALADINDLLVTVNATGHTITADNHFVSFNEGLETIAFADATSWNRTQMQAAAWFRGSAAAETITATDSADNLMGNGGADTLIGGFGNDIYHYASGDGSDTVRDVGFSFDTDLLKFTNLNAADLTFARSLADAGDLLVTVNATGHTITVDNHFVSNNEGLEQIQFADGTSVDRTGIANLAPSPVVGTSGNDTLTGTSAADVLNALGGNDSLNGLGGNDILIGGTGNDNLQGGTGNDTYLFDLGDGQDTIYDNGSGSDLDTVEFGAGIATTGVTVTQANSGSDLVATINGTSDKVILDDRITSGAWASADQVRFADGTVWSYATLFGKSVTPTAGNDTFYGDSGANTLAGGAGNDTLTGRAGNDTYLFNVGDGQDTIYDNGSGSDVDSVELGAGIATTGVTVAQANGGSDLALTINGTTDKVTLDDRITSGAWASADQVRFADGTVWSYATLFDKSVTPTAGNDTFYGDGGANTLAGGAGNDTLTGRAGNDTYLFNLGDGQDIIYDNGSGSDLDTLEFGSGIAPSDVTVTQGASGTDLVLTINGTTDKVTLDDRITSGAWASADQVRFADGTVWSYATLFDKSVTPTAGNDVFYGDGGANTLAGGAGNDTITGRGGNDSYLFNLGDGQDTIYDNGSGSDLDTVQLGAGIATTDVTVTQANSGTDLVVAINGTTDKVTLDDRITSGAWVSADQLRFADGTVWSYATLLQKSVTATTGNDVFYGDDGVNILDGGSGNDTLNARAGNDTLIGGGGDDTLTGASGNDIFVFNAGFGRDTITDFSAGSGVGDVIEFHDGIFANFAAVQAAATSSGGNTIITVDANTTITLQNVTLASLHQNDFLFV